MALEKQVLSSTCFLTLFWKVGVQNASNSVDFLLHLDDSRIFQVSEELGEGALSYC